MVQSGIGLETEKMNHGQLSNSQLEQQIDDMFERLDAKYFEMMNKVIERVIEKGLPKETPTSQ